MPNTRKLIDLDVDETSGVDRPAHLHDGFLVMKSASEITRVKALLLKALGKSKEDNLDNQEQIDLAVAKAVGEYEEKIANLEAALQAAQAQASDLAAKLEEIQSMQAGEESVEAGMHEVEAGMDEAASMMEETEKEMDEVEMAMAEMPEDVVKSLRSLPKTQAVVFAKAFKAQQDEVAKAAEEIRKERDIRLDSEAVAKSKAQFQNVAIDHETVAPALRKLASVDAGLAKTVEDVLTAADAQISESGLLKEMGSATTSVSTALDEVRAEARTLVEAGLAKTIEQGIEKALDANTELAKRYFQEVSR